MWKQGIFAAFLLVTVARADISYCDCDPERPQTMEARECSLSLEASKLPPEPAVFFLKDINPRKPNRWLALPRAQRKGMYELSQMTPEERRLLWEAAVKKAQELWGDEWGLAVNGDRVRTQCHPHIHIGKLLEGARSDNSIVVDDPSQIPVPDGDGMWIHPVGGKLRVHLGEQITEFFLMR